MTIRYVATKDIPVDELTPYPGNARRGDVPRIQESIKRHGQYRSLVVQAIGGYHIILAGNHTHAALQAEGYATARCEIIECTPDEAARINLADNRMAEIGSWDDAALAELLRGLDGDFDGTGYTYTDLDKILHGEELPEAGDADTTNPYLTWGVVVMCDTEDQQIELLTRFAGEGLNPRAIMGASE